MVLIMLYSGISQTFIFGQFPLLVKDDDSWKFYCLAVFGIVDTLGSIGFGLLSDKIGKFNVLYMGFFFHTAIYAFCFYVDSPSNHILMAVAGVFGLGDAVFNTQITATLSHVFSK